MPGKIPAPQPWFPPTPSPSSPAGGGGRVLRGARLEAAPAAAYLWGQRETEGTIAWRGRRSHVIEFTPGTDWATDPLDYTLSHGRQVLDLSAGIGFPYQPAGGGVRRFDRIEPRGGLAESTYKAYAQRQAQLADMVLVLSEGAIEGFLSGTALDVRIEQPDHPQLPSFGVVRFVRYTTKIRDPLTNADRTVYWWEPDPAAAAQHGQQALVGRILLVPYLDASGARPWSMWSTTFETNSYTTAQTPQKIAGTQKWYRSPFDKNCLLKGQAWVHVVLSNADTGALIDAHGSPRSAADKVIPPGVTGVDMLWRHNAPGDFRALWQGWPHLGFRLRGRKMVWPGQATPKYSANCAAVRYDVERTVRGLPAHHFDTTSVQAAVAACATTIQLKYAEKNALDQYVNVPASAGGRFGRYEAHVEHTNASYQALVDQLDFCWQGVARADEGLVGFFPGVLDPAQYPIQPREILAWGVQTQTAPLSGRVNALGGAEVGQDQWADWLPSAVPAVHNTARQSRDGLVLAQQVGTLSAVDGFFRGVLLMHVAADRLWDDDQRLQLQIDSSLYYLINSVRLTQKIRPGVRLSLTPPAGAPIDLSAYMPAGQTYALLLVEQVAVDPDDFTLDLVCRPLSGDPYQPHSQWAIAPDRDWTGPLSVDDWGLYDEAIAPPGALACTPFLLAQDDGSFQGGLTVTWTNAFRAQGTEIEFAKGADKRTALVGQGAQSHTRLLEAGDWQVRARHEFAPAAGATKARYSDWTAALTCTVGTDTTAPAAPTQLQATALPDRVLVTWAYPTEVDYAQTRVWIGAADQQNPTYHYIKGSEIEIETALTGSQTIAVQHGDHTGNWSTAATATVVLRGPSGDQTQWIYRRDKTNPPTITAPTTTDAQRKNDNYLPTGWARHELAPLSVYRFVYGTYRTKARTATQWTEYQQTLTLVDSQDADESTRVYFVAAATLSIGDAKLPSDLLDGDLVIATQSGRCYEQESNGTALREKYRFNAPVDPGDLVLKASNTPASDKVLGWVSATEFQWLKVRWDMLSVANSPATGDLLGYREQSVGDTTIKHLIWYDFVATSTKPNTDGLSVEDRKTSATSLAVTLAGKPAGTALQSGQPSTGSTSSNTAPANTGSGGTAPSLSGSVSTGGSSSDSVSGTGGSGGTAPSLSGSVSQSGSASASVSGTSASGSTAPTLSGSISQSGSASASVSGTSGGSSGVSARIGGSVNDGGSDPSLSGSVSNGGSSVSGSVTVYTGGHYAADVSGTTGTADGHSHSSGSFKVDVRHNHGAGLSISGGGSHGHGDSFSISGGGRHGHSDSLGLVADFSHTHGAGQYTVNTRHTHSNSFAVSGGSHTHGAGQYVVNTRHTHSDSFAVSGGGSHTHGAGQYTVNTRHTHSDSFAVSGGGSHTHGLDLHSHKMPHTHNIASHDHALGTLAATVPSHRHNHDHNHGYYRDQYSLAA